MIKIKKVLNSSVVLVIDDQGKEFVLFGKGIGYGQKNGAVVEENKADQIFMPVENFKAKELLDLLDAIPPDFIGLTQKIVNRAEQQLKTKLNSGIYFTLMDHLNFAVERYRKNINITNRVYWEIKNYYTEEFNIGCYALNLVNKTFEIDLPQEEAANIAFHLINAQSERSDSHNGMKYAKMIGSIVNLVRYTLNIKTDTKNVHYLRFITHVKFFAERFFEDIMLEEKDNVLFSQIANLYPQSMNVALKIKAYIAEVYGKTITNEELTYLAVHIQRLINYNELGV